MVERQTPQKTMDKQTNMHRIVPFKCLQLVFGGVSDGNVNTNSAELLTSYMNKIFPLKITILIDCLVKSKIVTLTPENPFGNHSLVCHADRLPRSDVISMKNTAIPQRHVTNIIENTREFWKFTIKFA